MARNDSDHSAHSVGLRVADLLDAMQAAGPQAQETGEELVRTLMAFYGAGLSRVVAELDGSPAGREILSRLAADPAVSGLLVLHDLHPQDTEQRVQAALEKVRPYLGSHAGDIDYLGIDPDGVVRLRLAGSCHGCPSSEVTVRTAVEQAIQQAAPEVAGIEVAGVASEAAAGARTPDDRPLLPLEPVTYASCPAEEVAP